MYLLRAPIYQTFSSLKEGVKMDARWTYQCETERVHHGFKFGRLAGLVTVLIMHLGKTQSIAAYPAWGKPRPQIKSHIATGSQTGASI